MLKQSVKVERPAKAGRAGVAINFRGLRLRNRSSCCLEKRKGTPPGGNPAGCGTGRNSRMRTVASALGPA
jgi:hypothetical protein